MIPLIANLSGNLNLVLSMFALILVLGLLLKRIHQPYIIAYILSGIIMGPSGFNMIRDQGTIEILGEFGLIILMFFIGLEISLPRLIEHWRIPLFGTGMQILFSLLLVGGIGVLLGWGPNRIILLGFIISLSSSAVVIKLVEEHAKDSKIGESAISILLTQDVAIAPMIIVISLLGGEAISFREIALQGVGGLLMVGLLIFLLKRKEIHLPFANQLAHDHELQVFAGLLICFGMALLTSMF